jgi:hypothetical protein
MPCRPEITGKNISDGGHHGSTHRGQDRGVADDPDAFSIRQFCLRHNISEGFYFKLKKLGLGPREMEVGARVLISKESAAAWRGARETADATPNG